MRKKSVAHGPLGTEDDRKISHDLRNDMAVIVGCCDLLGDAVGDDPQALRHLQLLRQAVERITHKFEKHYPRSASRRIA